MSELGSHDEPTADNERVEGPTRAESGCPAAVDSGHDDETAQNLVPNLLNAGTVTPVVDERVLVHEPSGAALESLWQLDIFHKGRTAAADAGETES